MTLYEFNILDLNERMQAVNQLGTFLYNHVTQKARCNLYAINMFFVEVVYDPEHNTIVEITAFKTGNNLDKYSKLKL